MGMTSFSLLMIILVAAFLPAASVRRWLDRLVQGSRRYTLFVNARQGTGFGSPPLVKAFDRASSSRRRRDGTAGEGEWPRRLDGARLVAAVGQSWRGYALFERLSRSLPLLWPSGS